DSTLRAELVRMGREDQAARDGFGAAVASDDTAFARRLMQGDSARTARLREIVRRHGWPGRSLVGEDGAESAWLVLQHTNSVEFQREMLPVLWRAAERGEMRRADVAMLEDRVLVRDGRPQRYGNSFSLREGRLVPDPIDDLPGLEHRRAEMGLPAMAEYVRVLGEAYGMPVTWPPTP
ncbi:MAG TPA: DUF6624 domain-containing protein, partial [Gemmatimonadales bacterium]|nr:DUF6624 domain-containing protein [Gemmatimonadales bacterium]